MLKDILRDNPTLISSVRFFLGYSGWSNTQLDEELEEKSWLVLNKYQQDLVFSTDDNEVWKHLMESLGGKFEIMSKFPLNPSDN